MPSDGDSYRRHAETRRAHDRRETSPRLCVSAVKWLFVVGSLLVLVNHAVAQPSTAPATLPSTQPAFEIVGRLDAREISESSGIVESRRYPGVYWTHNDSGNGAEIFAITREGKLI